MIQQFTDRFNIDVGLSEARKRFVNRANNLVFTDFYNGLDQDLRYHIHLEIASALGERYVELQPLPELIGDDFLRNLQALETFYSACVQPKMPLGSLEMFSKMFEVDSLIPRLMNDSEIDLEIKWINGKFIRSGAKLLDDRLVNDNLHWLRGNKYKSVITPFEKGLEHLLHSEKRPQLLSDVITDMYEALEALSRIVTGRPNRDLSANQQLFISKVNASEHYKKILAEYVSYANAFRHAIQNDTARPVLSSSEVESFVYMTGLFIRLAVQE